MSLFLKEKIHRITASAVTRKQIWRVWTDINHWHTWDEDIEWAKLTQPFQQGSVFTLKPRSGPMVSIELFAVDTESSFTDLAKFPLAKMYSIHRMKDLDGGLMEITHIVRVEGLLASVWWQLVGKSVAAGMPAQAKNMIARAQNIDE